MNERNDIGEQAVTWVELARDLGIPASAPRERIHEKARGLAHQCRGIGARAAR